MGREIKRQVSWFQVDDTDAMARHMEKMAEKGWLLDEVDNWFWHFRRSDPVKVKYAVTYFPDASVFDPAMPEGQETYADYCAAAGWELAAAYGPVQYFRAARENPLPIETDETVKLDAVRRTMRKTFVRSYGLFLLLPAVCLPLMAGLFWDGPVAFCSQFYNLASVVLMVGILLFCGGLLLDYLVWVLRSKRSIDRGGRCVKPHTKARLWSSGAMMALCAAAVAAIALQAEGMRNYFFVQLAVYAGIMFLGRWVLRKLKGRSENKSSVVAGYLCFAVAAGILVSAAGAFLYPPLARLFQEPEEKYTYTTPGGGSITWTVYHDELPVTLEDLGFRVSEEDHCSYRAEVERSPLASVGKYRQEALHLDSGLPDLTYRVYETPWPWLLEQCWEQLLEEERDSPFPLEEIDPTPWGAIQACQPEDLDVYYLLYPNRVVLIRGVEMEQSVVAAGMLA